MWKLVFVSLTISIARLIVITEASFFGDYDLSFGHRGFGGVDRRQPQTSNFDAFDNDGIEKVDLGSFSISHDDYQSAGSDIQSFAGGKPSHGGRRRGAGRPLGRKNNPKKKKDEEAATKKQEETSATTEPYLREGDVEQAIFNMLEPSFFSLSEARASRLAENKLKRLQKLKQQKKSTKKDGIIKDVKKKDDNVKED